MASYKRRQSSDYNQSVPETQPVPETHAYQEKHFQPTLNPPVSENHSETEYGSTVTPDTIENRDDKSPRSTYTESCDQPGEDDLLKQQLNQNLQGNSDTGTQYSIPDVSSGVSSGPGGYTTYDPGTMAAATTTTAASTAVVSSTAASLSSVAIATVGTVVIAATLVLPLIIGVPSAIIFDEISVTDTTIYYSIYFEDYEEDMELTVCLHNNFTNRTHTVESESISVLEENLKPNMQYKLTVYGSLGTVLEDKTVTTEKGSYEPVLTVETAEFSMSDGLIHVSASLEDPKNRCSDFSLVFYDVKDNKRTEIERIPITDFSSEITMSPGLAKDTSVDGILAVECMDGSKSGVLYEKELTAYGNPYIGFKYPPKFTNGTITVECDIVDPAAARYDYHVMVYVENVEDQTGGGYFTTDGALENGIFTTDGAPDYRFHRGFVKVTWEGEGEPPLYYEYDTVTVGVATMKNEITSYSGRDYEVKYEIEMTLNDDFNYLTDSSGEWRQDKYPEFASDISGQTSYNTFYEVRRTGDNTYVAVFLADTWTEAVIYRLNNTLFIGSSETPVPTFTRYNNAMVIERETNGDTNVSAVYTGSIGVSIAYASLVGSDGSKVNCIVTSSDSEYRFTTDLRNLNTNDTYSIYFYNSSGNAMFRDDGLKFENAPVLTSATYMVGATITATAVFDYTGTEVSMYDVQSSTVDATGEQLTLSFIADTDITSGTKYFKFISTRGAVSYDYHWKVVFQEST